MAKPRDSAAEYAHRVRGIPKGQRAAARGHGKSERPQKPKHYPEKPGHRAMDAAQARKGETWYQSDVLKALNAAIARIPRNAIGSGDNRRMQVVVSGDISVVGEAAGQPEGGSPKGRAQLVEESEEGAEEPFTVHEEQSRSIVMMIRDIKELVEDSAMGRYRLDEILFANLIRPLTAGEWSYVSEISFAPAAITTQGDR